MGGLLIVLVVACLGGGGAFYYFKILKPKKDAAKGSSNLDDLDFEEYDEDEPERRRGNRSRRTGKHDPVYRQSP